MTAKKQKMYLIEVIGNKDYVGNGAGGVQFAYGQAKIPEGRMVRWYQEHEGYKVTEITEEAPD